MLKTALIILTLGSGGATELAITEADSAEDCRNKADMVGQILADGGYTVTAMRCGETGLALTPFEHGNAEADMFWHYLVTIKGDALEDGFDLLAVEPGSCEVTADDQICAVSAQGPVGE